MAPPRKLPSGKWQARLPKDPVTKREPTRNFTRKIDAQNWLDENTADRLTGKYVDPRAGKMTLQRFYDEWAPLQVWQSSTRELYDGAIRKCGLADVALSRITETHGARWVRQMIDQPLAPTTIESRVTYLCNVLRAAVKAKRISENPFADLVLPKKQRAEFAMVIPTELEVGKIRDAASEFMECVICLGAFAGLRIGEVCALKVTDIGWLTRTLKVERQIHRKEIRPPKHNSVRVVYLPDELLQMLSRHVATLDPQAEGGWLFPSPRRKGRPCSEGAMLLRWDRLRKTEALNVPHLDFRMFRHYYASGLIAAGCDVVAVQTAMGHADSTITLKVYTHLWPKAGDRTRAAAAAMMRGSVHDHSDSDRTTSSE